MKRLQIGLAGAGLIGAEHARFITESNACDLAGVADPTARGASIASNAEVPHFPDLESLIGSVAVDAVIVAVPTALHEDVALACIERNLPVLIEKPIADTVAAAARIAHASEAAGVPVLVGHHRRHSPDFQNARRLVSAGKLGDMVAANGMWMARKPDTYFETEWRRQPGGGPILINLIHEIDCLRFVMGDVLSVQAFIANEARGLAVEDTAAIALRFSSGALATFIVTDAVPSPWFWDAASGQGAYFPYQHGDSYFFGGTAASLALPSMQLRWHAENESWQHPLISTTVPISQTRCYTAQLSHFIEVAKGWTPAICTAREGLNTLATTIATVKAAATGASVNVEDLMADETAATGKDFS